MTHPLNRIEEILDIPVIHLRYVEKSMCGIPVASGNRVTRAVASITCVECIREALNWVDMLLKKRCDFEGTLTARKIETLELRRDMLLRKLRGK